VRLIAKRMRPARAGGPRSPRERSTINDQRINDPAGTDRDGHVSARGAYARVHAGLERMRMAH
jgi:hypothetical protein